MRRRYLLLLIVPLVGLLALGAIPGVIGGGDVVYVTAEEIDLEDDGTPPSETATETIPVENLSENRFPFTTGAIDDGVSDSHEEGHFDFQAAFTHTPSDEFSELREWNANAVDEDTETVYLESNGTYYRLEITPASDVES